jgi:DNA helicase HerA-like ATPase
MLSRTLTERTNASVLSSSLNKLSDLREASLAWAPSKTKESIYVGDIINSGAPTVINMGAYRTPGSKNFEPAVSDTVSQRMTRMALRLLWSYVKSNCSGWQAQGKRIPLFFDEVADIASGGENDDTTNVVADAMKEGRSRGLALFLGCQSPSQMPPSVRMQVLGARSKFWFNLHNAQDLKMAVEDLASGSDKQPYSQQNLREIDNGWCAGIMRRTTSDGSGTVTPPFTLRVPMAEKWSEALFDNVDVGDALVDYDEAMERGARV